MSDDERLPLPNLVNWPNFPFEGDDMRVVKVQPFADAEPPREGEHDNSDCMACTDGDDKYIWTNDRWRLKTLAPFSPLPLSLIGAVQLTGFNLPIWGLTLPPLDEAITTPIANRIVEGLA